MICTNSFLLLRHGTSPAYQWLSVCVALLVIPSTRATPWCFAKMGIAGTCVFGNVATAVLTALLLMIGNFPSTELAFGFFVFVMYAGFPATVFSQLTTGPMLDAIAPEDKIGYVQGLNNSSMNFGMALAPWVFGLLADAAGTNVAIGTGIGFSLLAGAANTPLMWHPLMGKPAPKIPAERQRLPGEDEELLRKILDGDAVDPELAMEINYERGLQGKPAAVPRVKPYEEEKDALNNIAKGAGKGFKYRMDLYDRALAGIVHDSSPAPSPWDRREFDRSDLVQLLNTIRGHDQALVDEAAGDLGQWMGDYLADNGYSPHTTSIMMKQMFMSAFPPITREKEVTEENVEAILLKEKQMFARYAELQKKRTTTKTLAVTPHGTGWW